MQAVFVKNDEHAYIQQSVVNYSSAYSYSFQEIDAKFSI